MLVNITVGWTRAGIGLHPPNLILSPAITGRHIMKRTNVYGRQFPDDEDRDGPRNVGIHTA